MMLIILVAVKFFVIIGVGDLGLRSKQNAVSIESPDHLLYPPLLHPNLHILTFADQVCRSNARLGLIGEYTSAEWTEVKKTQGITTQFYNLGIINIAPLHERTSLTTKVWVQSLGTVLGRC